MTLIEASQDVHPFLYSVHQVSVVWWRFAFNFYIVFLSLLCLCSRRGSLFPGCEYQLSQVIQYLEFNHFAPLFLCLPQLWSFFKYVDIQFADLGTADRLNSLPILYNQFRVLINTDWLLWVSITSTSRSQCIFTFSLLGLRMVLNLTVLPLCLYLSYTFRLDADGYLLPGN